MRFARLRTMNAAVVVTLAISAAGRAATLHVPADYPAIQACINAAVSGVDECVVAPGTYHEKINFLGKAITVRSSGGRDVTTIDATGLNGSAVTCITAETRGTVLDGFTITGGTGRGGLFGTEGGGMYNNRSSPTVTNCTFSGNRAERGSGMYNGNLSNPTVTNCRFSANRASDAGGGMENNASSATVTNCTFSGNSAGFSGGGMINLGDNVMVTNCTFNENTATNGVGGGMYNLGSGLRVSSCTFSRNTAGGSQGGGGMLNGQGSQMVTNCTFRGNTATYGPGGGMYNSIGSLTVTNCTFGGNTAKIGGGMLNYNNSPMVLNCTFSGNTATSLNAGIGGGGMASFTSNPTVANCILWGNSPDEIHNDKSAPIIRFSDVQGGLPAEAVDGGGDINLDPMFIRSPDPGPDDTWDGVDDDYGDLRLRVGSPCIDAGDLGFVAQPTETDLEGHARVLCGVVDMGAYEFGVGDYDCDQSVNLSDFANWSSCVTDPSPSTRGDTTSACAAFDFDGDGDVDLIDFAGFELEAARQHEATRKR